MITFDLGFYLSQPGQDTTGGMFLLGKISIIMVKLLVILRTVVPSSNNAKNI